MEKTMTQTAYFATSDSSGTLLPLYKGSQPIRMHLSQGTARQLLFDTSCEKPFGLDQIRFAPSEGVAMHTHPGSHILLCIGGKGTLEMKHSLADNLILETVNLEAGIAYLVPSLVPHSVYAKEDSELLLLVIGNDHRRADATDRLNIAE